MKWKHSANNEVEIGNESEKGTILLRKSNEESHNKMQYLVSLVYNCLNRGRQ
jgi:hypothetical protein